MMSSFTPSQLPSISSVEIVSLYGLHPNRVSEYMLFAKERPFREAIGETAQQLAGLWRALPVGSQARCHTPPFGLRFLENEEVVCQASICWRCNNIFGDVRGVSFFYQFDSEAETSQLLLAEIEALTDIGTQ